MSARTCATRVQDEGGSHSTRINRRDVEWSLLACLDTQREDPFGTHPHTPVHADIFPNPSIYLYVLPFTLHPHTLQCVRVYYVVQIG